MNSKISFFKIMREDMRHRIWMLALSCLGSFLALPITFLLGNQYTLMNVERLSSDFPVEEIMGNYYASFFLENGLFTVCVVLGLGSCITAVCGFRYLYSKKMVDLYHSIPVKRGRLFFAVYLNGLLIWFLPMLACMALTLILIFANLTSAGAVSAFGSVFLVALRMTLVAVAAYLTLYHFFLICVMISGNALNALFSSALLGFGAVAFYDLLMILANCFLDTFASVAPVSFETVAWMSPLWNSFSLAMDFSETGAGVLFLYLGESSFYNPIFPRICNALLCAFNLWFAYHLYRKRPSELSERGVTIRPAQVLLRAIASVLIGLCSSMIFYSIAGENSVPWQVFGLLLGSIVAFGVSDIIINMNFKCFFAHKLQMGIAAAAACLVLFIFTFDLTGFDRRIPQKSTVKEALITISNYGDGSDDLEFDEDGTVVSRGSYGVPTAAVDKDTLHSLLPLLISENNSSGKYAGSAEIWLKTFSGYFRRRYRLTDKSLEALRPIIESDAYLSSAYRLSEGLCPMPTSIQAESRYNYEWEMTLDETAIREIMEAYVSDFKDNATLEDLRSGIQVAYLELEYPRRAKSSQARPASLYYGRSIYYTESLPVYTHYTRTLEKLKEYFPKLLLDKEDLEIDALIFDRALPYKGSTLYLKDVFGLGDDTENLFAATIEKCPEEEGEESAASTKHPYPYEAPTAQVFPDDYPSSGKTSVTVTDKDEIAALLPYLYPGYKSSGYDDSKFLSVGNIRLTDGSYLSLHVKVADLPLNPPESLVKELGEG